MRNYDVAIIGKGASGYIMEKAAEEGYKVALIDKPPIGGTCMNFGCIPSKTLIYPANLIRSIQSTSNIGIDKAEIKTEFSAIMNEIRENRGRGRKNQKKNIENISNVDYYPGEAHFIDKKTIEVNDIELRADKIFIVNGARPFIPPIKGLEDVNFLTNESILELKNKPDSIIIIGGGYISLEFAHFLSAFGVEVTIIQRSNKLLSRLEPEISERLEKEVKTYTNLLLNTEAVEVKNKSGKVEVLVEIDEEKQTLQADKVFVAAGRKSNADTLSLENTSIETNKRGYIKVNKFLETDQKNVWATGDINGKYMFKHVANKESRIAWYNANHENKKSMDYSAVPYALYCHPEVASVGLTEKEARKEHELLIGESEYNNVVKGRIMDEHHGFVKAIVDKETRKLLGSHIIGPHASILIQETVNVVANNKSINFITNSIHTFPSLSEIILKPLINLK
ncbi:MAG: dihydrolipoyl dehydrogenase [Candidatus Cloacimonetes bacterium]|nr:dihydrolipoyl dehydrogenase [Candidatus Cloacimonadota bacterium]MBS3767317.1 dihydrolipoyl dehydrogenase [Candidatus Cloacimonadota bacterium]